MIQSRPFRWALLIGIALSASALSRARASDSDPAACAKLLSPATSTRFMRAAGTLENPRLKRFLTAVFLRYSGDPEVEALATAICTPADFEIRPILGSLTGKVRVRRAAETLEITIPTVQIVEDTATGASKAYGKVADGLSARFVKLMTGLTMGAERAVELDPSVRSVVFASNVVNESLAYLLVDLGFATPIFGRALTREEIHFMLTEKRVPPTLYEAIEKLRKADPNFAAKPPMAAGVGPGSTPDQKELLSIPFELRIALP